MPRQFLTAIVVLMISVTCAEADSNLDAAMRSGDRLVSFQEANGSWLEFGFTGESVAGLAQAYKVTGDEAYKLAAESGAQYSLYDEAGYEPSSHKYTYGLFASGAYALTRVSDVSADPASNAWRTAVVDYYQYIRVGGAKTSDFINWYLTDAEDSGAVYDLAYHALAASYVDATDKGDFRSGLITALADIDNTDNAPVMALGAAVWALAETGPMDSTIVDPGAAPGSLWDGVSLSGLPGLLMGLQAEDGSFYTTFDPNMGSGFTETTAMGTLGLSAANTADTSLDYDNAIAQSRAALASGVGGEGEVYWGIGENGYPAYHFLGGETLLSLLVHSDANDCDLVADIAPVGSPDGIVDGADLGALLARWKDTGVSVADIAPVGAPDGIVDGADLGALLARWKDTCDTGGAPAVPEPTTLILVGTAGVTMLIRQKRGRRR